MKKTLYIFIFCLCLGGVSNAQVDAKYNKTLKQMFAMTGSEDTYKIAIEQIYERFKQQYPNVNEEVWTEMKDEFANNSLNSLVQMLAPIYNKYMTQKDLEGLIEFYETPLGKNFTKNYPLILQESMQMGEQWGMNIQQNFQSKMKEKGY